MTSWGKQEGGGLGLSDFQLRSLISPKSPLPRSSEGRGPVRDAQFASYLLVLAYSLCFSQSYRSLPEEGPISSSKALSRHQEQLCSPRTRPPPILAAAFSPPVLVKPSRRSLASFASTIALASSLSPWKAGCFAEPRCLCSTVNSLHEHDPCIKPVLPSPGSKVPVGLHLSPPL